MDAKTGALVRRIPGYSSFAIAVAGGHVWLPGSYNSNSVTEIDARTGIVRVIQGSKYGFSHPVTLAASGGDVWVSQKGSVRELDATTGSLVRVISGSAMGSISRPP